jgi:hypothetical protein
MSSVDKLVEESKLIPFLEGMVPCEREVRRLLLTKRLYDEIVALPESKKDRGHKLKIQAHLKRFVVGEEIDNQVYMKCLDKKEDRVWAIRILNEPQYRIFGAFLELDCFIAFHSTKRAQLRKQGFATDVKRTIREWNALRLGKERFHAKHFTSYVSNGRDRLP